MADSATHEASDHDNDKNGETSGAEDKLLDSDEQLTDAEDSTDEASGAEELFPTDEEDELDREEECSTTDNTQDVLPFAGFANAATGEAAPVPTAEEAAAAKKLLGIESPPHKKARSSSGECDGQDTPPVCFRRAGSGSKWC